MDIVIKGIRPYDGTYPFNVSDEPFTTREYGYIKRLAGYVKAMIPDGLSGQDPELICAFAIVALRRADKIGHHEVNDAWDAIIDADDGSQISLAGGEPEADAEDDDGPPQQNSSSSGNTETPGSRTNSETSDENLEATGTPGSDTAGLVRIRSVS